MLLYFTCVVSNFCYTSLFYMESNVSNVWGEMNLIQNVYIIFVIDYVMPSTIFVEFYKAKLS